ncbi:transglycosylase domain-containing protein [Pseudonocardia acaciae]|uniref:transglycosylase domain-containing protein n=1 Tax=Pseudonocardia acaciae TaxID=551276 RepID=UPI0006857CD6|nr:transglycosylase domain-containing protein [Pseudonocardia acaciae]
MPRKTSGWRRFRRVALVLVVLGVFAPILAFAIGWIAFDVPTPEDLATSQVATVSYSNGDELTKIAPSGNVNRTKVPLKEVPLEVQHAVLAAEDRTFYTNLGFDPVGILRAAWNQVNGVAGGGSTITQQYVKITTGQDQYSLFRKFKEIVLAAKISKEKNKDQILEDYLNTIYLGRGAYGIQAAAKAYFNVDSKQLTPAQGALIAGMIQSPSRWDPEKNPTKARERWNFVMDGMVSQGWMNKAEREAATFPTAVKPTAATLGMPTDARGHIYSQIKAELEAKGITEAQLNQDGLKISTTIDPVLQKQAQQTAEKIMKQNPKNLRSSLVAIDPRDGGIRAYYGGDNGLGLDYASQVLKQPGSAFKPFAMAAALRQNPPIGLGKRFDGSSPQTIAGQTVANSEGENCDDCSLKTAMTKSINTVFYNLVVQIGPEAVAKAAHDAGIPNNLLANPNAGIALGDKEVHTVDMASAFATFAAEGLYRAPHMITRVTTAEGNVIYDGTIDPGEQRIDQQVARNVTESMMDVASHSRIGLTDGRAVASKTGTVQSRIQGQNNDAWMVGYTPSLSTAVWVGTDDNSPIKTSGGTPIYGRMVPGSIWQGFMNTALRGKPKEQFSKFTPLGTPPDDSDATASESASCDEDEEDCDRRRKRHRGDSENGEAACDFVACDDDGNPIGRRRGGSGSGRDSGDDN